MTDSQGQSDRVRSGPMDSLARTVAPASPGKAKRARTVEVYQALRMKIITMKLQPGQRLEINKLSGDLGYSRTPIREALFQLSSEYLVTAEPQRGFFVATVSKRELAEIIDLRAVLEAQLLSNAILNGDEAWEEGIVSAFYRLSRTAAFSVHQSLGEQTVWRDNHKRFHDALVAGSQLLWKTRFRDLLEDHLDRYRHFTLGVGFLDDIALAGISGRRLVAHLDQVVGHAAHEAMMKAVLDRDEKTAVRLMERHYDMVRDLFDAFVNTRSALT